MLTQNQLKFFSSLRIKKFRELHNSFLAEGEKIVTDILGFTQCNIKITTLLAISEYLKDLDYKKINPGIEVIEVSAKELKRISSLSTPNKAILICAKPNTFPDYKKISAELSVFLEDIHDPGNLGTIIRTADWFSIRNIFCSKESVDVYNPKVIQSSMGAICKTQIFYEEPEQVISNLKNYPGYKVYGTFLRGQNIFKEMLSERGLVVFGNESRGISRELYHALDVKLTIPAFGKAREGSESLNIASAVSIVLSEFRRRIYSK